MSIIKQAINSTPVPPQLLLLGQQQSRVDLMSVPNYQHLAIRRGLMTLSEYSHSCMSERDAMMRGAQRHGLFSANELAHRSSHTSLQIIENQDEKQETIKWLAKEHPGEARMLFGWNPETDVVETVDFSNLIEMVSIVRLSRSI